MRAFFLRRLTASSFALAGALVPAAAQAQQGAAGVTPAQYAQLQWRNVGPFRAGRVSAVSAPIGQPSVFYIGTPGGGVWKTTSAGVTWFPISDSLKTVSSIGAIEVAPSDPNVIYVGTGDMITGAAINEGNGVYKSTDAGRSWQHLGLDATKQIPSIVVDPKDANLVLVAAQGDVHHKSTDRGVYRSTDGGKTWTRTLFVDEQTGIQKLARAYDEPSVIFATTVRHWGPPVPPPPGTPRDTGFSGTTIYKSTDEGLTWTEVKGGGLPKLNGRTSIAVAQGTHAQRVFFVTNTGLYRSDDGGTTWRQMDKEDPRVHNGQGGYNCGVYVDPQNPDVVYVINTAEYRSTDGGNTFTGFKGAPGGDDPQQMWIDPTNGSRMLLGLDQGATVTLDGGANWSTWYNQSTEQVYHITTDNSFPYWVYATQQDAGAIRTLTRGDLGAVGPLDWTPVPAWEWGSIAVDPLNPNTVYGSGYGLVKIMYPSNQWINVSPSANPDAKLRMDFNGPMQFAPWNHRQLLAGFQYLMSTTDGGAHWTKVSPDVTLEPGEKADTTKPSRASIESIGASGLGGGIIWVGTNNGRISVSRNRGATWSDVTIPNLPYADRAEVIVIEPSHQNASEAYAVIDLHRTGDYAPYVFRTRDFGKSWTRITNGLPVDQPSGSFARVIRADSVKAGLLFTGTESGVYVSFDDGDSWQSLMNNLPNTSYRDITMKGNDLIVGTYGRGIWVLDDYSMLRQLGNGVASAPAHLFAPGAAHRLRRNLGADTPFQPEVPQAKNPAPGAQIDYWLGESSPGGVALDVLDAAGHVIRHMSSEPITPVKEAKYPPEPSWWLATPQPLATTAGMHRVNWDLRYDNPKSFSHSYEINANPGETPVSPEGPLVAPGTYTLRLWANGVYYSQPVKVLADPRSPAKAADVAAQVAFQVKMVDAMNAAYDAWQSVAALRTSLGEADSTAKPELRTPWFMLGNVLDSLGGLDTSRGRGFNAGARPAPTFRSVNDALVQQLEAQDYADMAPTPAMRAAFAKTCGELKTLTTRWQKAIATDLPAVNAMRRKYNLPEIAAPKVMPKPFSC